MPVVPGALFVDVQVPDRTIHGTSGMMVMSLLHAPSVQFTCTPVEPCPPTVTPLLDVRAMIGVLVMVTGNVLVTFPAVVSAVTDTVNDLLSGSLDYMVQNPVFALAQHKEGKMRVLGVGSNERLQAVPDLPTMTEQGIPMNVIGWWSASVPSATPKEAVNTINKWFVDAVGTPEAKTFLNNGGGDPLITTPDQAQQMMLKDIENWREYEIGRAHV